MRKINRLTKVAAVATGIVCLFLRCTANVSLALLQGGRCVVMGEVPFTGREVRLPDWMSSVAIDRMLASIPILIVLWFLGCCEHLETKNDRLFELSL